MEYLGKKIQTSNFKKQRNNKQKIVNIKGGTIEKVRLFGGLAKKLTKRRGR